MMENTAIYEKLRRPPETALKTIRGGRLKGMTDINPQWRYQAMTEQFGPCGVGWTYTITDLWTEQTGGETVVVFARVNLFIKTGDAWSEPIPGIGGNQLVTVENSGPRANDECYKMAVTDALSVAMKALGLGADIYAGLWDGSKYSQPPPAEQQVDKHQRRATKADLKRIADAAHAAGLDKERVRNLAMQSPFCVNNAEDLLAIHVDKLIERIQDYTQEGNTNADDE